VLDAKSYRTVREWPSSFTVFVLLGICNSDLFVRPNRIGAGQILPRRSASSATVVALKQFPEPRALQSQNPERLRNTVNPVSALLRKGRRVKHPTC